MVGELHNNLHCSEFNVDYSSVHNIMSADKSYELWNNHVQNQTEKLQFILEKYSYTINSKHKGFTALEYAIMNKNVEMATILIDNGTEVNFNSDKYSGNYVSIGEEYSLPKNWQMEITKCFHC